MGGDSDDTADDGGRREQHRAQDDVRQLADRGIGEAGFQIISRQRVNRGHDDGEGGQVSGGDSEAQIVHQPHPHHVEDHAEHTEHAHLDHRHCMQQRTDRRRRDHRRGQPGMHGHDGGLGETRQVTEIDGAQQQRRGGDPVEQPGRLEIQRPRQLVGERQTGKQEGLGRADQVDQVPPAAVPGLFGLPVIDQRIGDEAEDLVEDHQREQVGGKGPADSRRQTYGESGEEPRLSVFLQASHIADAVDRGGDPQQRRNGCEHHSQRVHPKREIDARQDLEQGDLDGSPAKYDGRHGNDDQEFDDRRDQGHRVPEVGAIAEPQDCPGGQQGNCDG